MRIGYLLPLVGLLALTACKDEKKAETPRLLRRLPAPHRQTRRLRRRRPTRPQPTSRSQRASRAAGPGTHPSATGPADRDRG